MVLRLEDEQWDDVAADHATTQLRDELLELDVEGVDRLQEGTAPGGSKAADASTIGALVISLAASKPLLDAFTLAVQTWAARAGTRRVKMEIDGDVFEATDVTRDDQRRALDAWLARHTVVDRWRP